VHYYLSTEIYLRDGDKGKLIMECTGEGVLPVEVDADISFEGL
jgi:hypothetical protein